METQKMHDVRTLIHHTRNLKKEEIIAKIRSNELFHLNDNDADFSGACYHGVQYYDFQDISFINNTGMAHLIDLLRCLLEEGIEVQFVNVSEEIKNKIKSLGLESIINCN